MAHIYVKVWLHIVWSTKNRQHLLSDEIRKKVFQHIHKNARDKGFHICLINGYTDHLHILISMDTKSSIANVVNLLKGESSHWINSEKLTPFHFAWQEGYAVFSVSESRVEKIKEYILHQEEHHKAKNYNTEVKELLELHKIQFDEKNIV